MEFRMPFDVYLTTNTRAGPGNVDPTVLTGTKSKTLSHFTFLWLTSFLISHTMPLRFVTNTGPMNRTSFLGELFWNNSKHKTVTLLDSHSLLKDSQYGPSHNCKPFKWPFQSSRRYQITAPYFPTFQSPKGTFSNVVTTKFTTAQMNPKQDKQQTTKGGFLLDWRCTLSEGISRGRYCSWSTSSALLLGVLLLCLNLLAAERLIA